MLRSRSEVPGGQVSPGILDTLSPKLIDVTGSQYDGEQIEDVKICCSARTRLPETETPAPKTRVGQHHCSRVQEIMEVV